MALEYVPNAVDALPPALALRPIAVEYPLALAPLPYQVLELPSQPIGAMPSRLGSDPLVMPDEPEPTIPEGSAVGIGVCAVVLRLAA